MSYRDVPLKRIILGFDGFGGVWKVQPISNSTSECGKSRQNVSHITGVELFCVSLLPSLIKGVFNKELINTN